MNKYIHTAISFTFRVLSFAGFGLMVGFLVLMVGSWPTELVWYDQLGCAAFTALTALTGFFGLYGAFPERMNAALDKLGAFALDEIGGERRTARQPLGRVKIGPRG
jgi:hypothetical protein